MAKIEVAYPPGNPSSEVPAGGAAGTVLMKNSAVDYDDSWVQLAEGNITNLVADLAAKAPIASPTFTGQILIPDGSKPTPAIAFSSTINTGVYHDPAISATSILFSCGGVLTVRMSTSTFEFYAGINKMFSMLLIAGMMDVPNSGGIRIWSSVSATSGVIQAIFTRQYIRTLPSTVAALPAAATAGQGARAFVTDANGPVFGVAVVGGGAVSTPVYSNGAGWFVG